MAIDKMSIQRVYPKLIFEQATDLVASGKSAEGLRERTLRGYRKGLHLLRLSLIIRAPLLQRDFFFAKLEYSRLI